MADSQDYLYAADNVNLQAGGKSIFDQGLDVLGGIGQAMTMGAGAAVVSGIQSIYNTGVDLTNKVFGTENTRANVAKTLNEVDASWGAYYEKNKDVIDTAGFVAGSLIPGTLAIKGLKLAQAGTMGGAFRSVLGYTSTMEAATLDKALGELALQGGSIFTRINTAKIASISWGIADQVLQMAAYETATALTMKASPMLDNEDWASIAHDGIKNAAIGGALGGGINALFTGKILRDAGKLVEGRQRQFDVLENTGKLDLPFGDKAYAIADAALKLPPESFDPIIKLAPHGKVGVRDTLDVSHLLDNTLRNSVLRGTEQFQSAITNVIEGDTSVGGAFASSLVRILKEGFETKQSPDAIRDALGARLHNLASVSGIGNRPLNLEGGLRYFNPNAVIEQAEDGKVISKILSDSPIGDDPTIIGGKLGAKEQVWRVIGDESKTRIDVLGKDAKTAKEAFNNGADIVLNPTTKKIEFNPDGDIYTRVDNAESGFTSMFYNVRSGKNMWDAVPTIADVATAAPDMRGGLIINREGVQSGGRIFKFQTNIYNVPVDSVEATARHVWAASPELKTIGGVIDSRDISLLDALREQPSKAAGNLIIRDAQTGTETFFSDIQHFDSYVLGRKVQSQIDILIAAKTRADEAAIKALDTSTVEVPGTFHDELLAAYKTGGTDDVINRSISATTADEATSVAARLKKQLADIQATTASVDIRDLSYRLNATPEWVENNIAAKFDMNTAQLTPGWTDTLNNFKARDNLVVRYATGESKAAPWFPTADVQYATRVKEAQQKLEDSSASVLGDQANKLFLTPDAALTQSAQSTTNGASVFGASNAGYTEKIKAWAQYTGQLVSNLITTRVGDVLSKLQSPAARVLADKEVASEVATVMLKARTTQVGDLAIYTDDFGKRSLVDLTSLKQLDPKKRPSFEFSAPLSDDAAEFLATHQELHNSRMQQEKVLLAAHGIQRGWDPQKLYIPPIDTQRLPFFAYVKGRDATIFGSSDVGMITARTSAQLDNLAAQIEKDTEFRVVFKQGNEDYYKAAGEYDFQRVLNNSKIQSELRTKNLLGDYLPNMTPEAVVEDFVRYHQRMETKLIRDAVSTKYAQTFAEIDDLSKRYTQSQTSMMGGISQMFKRNVVDPFGDIAKTALNISKQAEFPIMQRANEFLDALGTRAWDSISPLVMQAKDGKISWEEANNKLKQFGINPHFTDADAFAVAQTAPERNLMQGFIKKANMLVANGMLRLDAANSILNIISTPILLGTEVSAIRQSIKNDPELLKLFNGNLTLAAPGDAVTVPNASKLIFHAVRNSMGEDSKELFARYRAIGTVKGQAAMFHEMIDDLSLVPGLVPSKYGEKVNAWVEKGSKLTFNTQAEDYTRFVTSDVMRQITDPIVAKGRMTEQEQNAFITIFTNRVQGNYVASQRPIAFQGTLGSAIGLFQTYQFNLFQQLFRHIENKDMKTLAVMGGLQSSIFGLNGLPMFDAINTQIVGNASINAKHNDAYSYAVKAAGKGLGDWLMYGTASAFPLFGEQSPAFYTRGDINPRNAFILPTSPADVPAVGASIKLLTSVIKTGQAIGNGSGATEALLMGLEHNGISRPLAGLSQVLSGRSTTSKGDLISAASDWWSIATMSRLLGAKPMDESLAMNTAFKQSAYQAVDKERIDSLGATIKEKLRNNQPLTSDDFYDFQTKYAAKGGRIEGYTAAIQRWNKAANTSIVNQVMRHNMTERGQRMNLILGGTPMPDFTNLAPPATE